MKTMLACSLCLICAVANSGIVTNNQGLVIGITNPPASVTLEWTASVTANVRTYSLYYGTNSRAYSTMVNAGAATNVTVTVQRGATYFFAVTALDLNFLESQFSNEVNYTATNPPASPLLFPVKTLVVDSKNLIDDPWQETGMQWAISANQSEQYFRLRIPQDTLQPATPSTIAAPSLRIIKEPPVPGK